MSITRAQIELSSKCNFRCITCRHGYFDYGENMTDFVCDILRTNILPGLKVLELQGTGESLLSSQSETMIKIAAEYGTEVTLITNGSLLDERMITELVKAEAQLVVSLDGSNSEIFSLHRPVGNFGRIIDGITTLREIRMRNKPNKFSLVVNMVLTQLNYEDLPSMIDLLSNLGVDFLFVSEVRECMPDKGVWERLNLQSVSHSMEFKNMIHRCEEFSKQRGIGFAFNPNIKPDGIKKRLCEAPWKHIFVSANGDVSICCELSVAFGNLNDRGLDEILNCNELTHFRNEMLAGNYDIHCQNCCLPWGLPY